MLGGGLPLGVHGAREVGYHVARRGILAASALRTLGTRNEYAHVVLAHHAAQAGVHVLQRHLVQLVEQDVALGNHARDVAAVGVVVQVFGHIVLVAVVRRLVKHCLQ